MGDAIEVSGAKKSNGNIQVRALSDLCHPSVCVRQPSMRVRDQLHPMATVSFAFDYVRICMLLFPPVLIPAIDVCACFDLST